MACGQHGWRRQQGLLRKHGGKGGGGLRPLGVLTHAGRACGRGAWMPCGQNGLLRKHGVQGVVTTSGEGVSPIFFGFVHP
jgi:hypothetical protein